MIVQYADTHATASNGAAKETGNAPPVTNVELAPIAKDLSYKRGAKRPETIPPTALHMLRAANVRPGADRGTRFEATACGEGGCSHGTVRGTRVSLR